LIVWALAGSYYPAEFRHWPAAEYWIVGGVTAILFFVSVLLHELGHSVVALHYKIPVRSITLFIFGGVAQIAAEPPFALAEFWIAIAGPLVSFGLFGFFTILQMLGAGFEPVLALAKYLAYINGALGLFNLIPGFPLDGGRVFRAVVWGITHDFRRATWVAASLGRLIAFLLIFYGIWQIFSSNFINGLWIAFIGWFLDNAAASNLRLQSIHDLLEGHKVLQVMSQNYAIISPQITLQQLADEHILGMGRRFFIVQDRNNHLAGILTLHNVKEVPRAEWLTTTTAHAMIPLEKMQAVQPETELWDAFEKMDQNGVNQLPVISDGQICGVLNRDGIISYLRTLQEVR
jgi:Zn-dependent protease